MESPPPPPEKTKDAPKGKGKGGKGKGGKGRAAQVDAESPTPKVETDAAAAKGGSSLPPRTGGPSALPTEEKLLWPHLEARQRWCAYVGAAATSAQLAIATNSLRDHAAAFGALGKKVDANARAAAARRCEHVWDLFD